MDKEGTIILKRHHFIKNLTEVRDDALASLGECFSTEHSQGMHLSQMLAKSDQEGRQCVYSS